MEHLPFTEEEKRVVVRILSREPKKRTMMFLYTVGLFPSLLMAGYSIWVQDFRATLIAYVALLAVMGWYLNDGQNNAQPLWSAVKKYEAAVGALQETDKSET